MPDGVVCLALPRYLGAFAWRFNRRFVLKTIHERLAIAATAAPPMPYRLLKLAEARSGIHFMGPDPRHDRHFFNWRAGSSVRFQPRHCRDHGPGGTRRRPS